MQSFPLNLPGVISTYCFLKSYFRYLINYADFDFSKKVMASFPSDCPYTGCSLKKNLFIFC